MKRSIVGLSAAVSMLLAVCMPAFALTSGTYGSSTYGSCNYGAVCSVTLISNGNVALNVTPTASGNCTVQSDQASVQTDDANGYTLMLSDATTNTALVNGGSSINAGGGTLASPAALTPNAWGYRVDGLGSFGSGPTTAQSNISPNATSFAAIKASNASADIIASTTSAANPAVATTIWYGVCANTNVASGSYSTQVTYTAVAN